VDPLISAYIMSSGRYQFALVPSDGFPGFPGGIDLLEIDLRPREYFAWLLLLETSILGVFASLDMLLFFIFWEIEVIPMFF